MNQNIAQLLSGFETVSLKDLEKVSLLDRMDTKYAFSIDFLPMLLYELRSEYRILSINDQRSFHYESLYFDTEQLELYQRHNCGKLNRYKIRIRKYLESSLMYFEIKFKNNKDRTIKSRLQINSVTDLSAASELLHEITPFELENLKGQLWVNYTRITLVSKNFSERLTLDLDLNFKKDDHTENVEGMVIAELKQNRSASSPFTRLLKLQHIHPVSISKYCLGVAKMIKGIRKNRVKEQIHLLNKTIYATASN